MNFVQAEKFVESLKVKNKDFDLATVKELCMALGLDLGKLNAVHIAGSNGKGSVTSFISSILIEDNYVVGTYTSPHLLSITERIKTNNREISREGFAAEASEIKKVLSKMKKKPSYFEFLTALAFKHFLEKNVDFLVIETGMGGRLDATNIIESKVQVITEIALEHEKSLGSSIEKIASEKAGIIKCNSMCVALESNPGFPVIRSVAELKETKIVSPEFKAIEVSSHGNLFDLLKPVHLTGIKTKMIGFHQVENASLALGAVHCLQLQGFHVSKKARKQGIAKMLWPGRIQVLRRQPLIIVDAAHNPNGAESLGKALKLFNYQKLILVFGALKDKNVEGMLGFFKPDELILTAPKNDRAFKVKELKEKFIGNKVVVPVKKAIKNAVKQAKKNDLVLVTGSLYTIAEALKSFK